MIWNAHISGVLNDFASTLPLKEPNTNNLQVFQLMQSDPWCMLENLSNSEHFDTVFDLFHFIAAWLHERLHHNLYYMNMHMSSDMKFMCTSASMHFLYVISRSTVKYMWCMIKLCGISSDNKNTWCSVWQLHEREPVNVSTWPCYLFGNIIISTLPCYLFGNIVIFIFYNIKSVFLFFLLSGFLIFYPPCTVKLSILINYIHHQ